MERRIDPPRNSFDQLPTPLTDGERRVIGLFDQKLRPEWEIYVQPHLKMASGRTSCCFTPSSESLSSR